MARDCEGLGTNSRLWFPSRRSSVTPPDPCGSHWPVAGMSCACAISIQFGLGSEGLGLSPRSSRAGLREGSHLCPSSLPPGAPKTWRYHFSTTLHGALDKPPALPFSSQKFSSTLFLQVKPFSTLRPPPPDSLPLQFPPPSATADSPGRQFSLQPLPVCLRGESEAHGIFRNGSRFSFLWGFGQRCVFKCLLWGQ